MIDWDDLLDYSDPETAWANFKKILFDKIDDHIPKFTIKTEYQPPWFDSDCYAKCKEKDKLHKNFKQKKTIESELKFKAARREFKALVKSKMRENLDFNDRNILTKKFWSHVKSVWITAKFHDTYLDNSVLRCKTFGLLWGRILYSCFDFIVLAKLFMLRLRFFET